LLLDPDGGIFLPRPVRTGRCAGKQAVPVRLAVYSNAAKAELFLNGKSQGTRDNDGNAIFIWKDIKLSPGKNQVEARAEKGGTPVSDSCVWTLK
jgi:hypothetical protein